MKLTTNVFDNYFNPNRNFEDCEGILHHHIRIHSTHRHHYILLLLRERLLEETLSGNKSRGFESATCSCSSPTVSKLMESMIKKNLP
jgi:hypothetical protein